MSPKLDALAAVWPLCLYSASKMEVLMKIQKILILAVLLVLLSLAASPAFAVSKEIVQLQTQVQALQDQIARMQQTFDERMGVMKNLVEQNTDVANKVNLTLKDLQALISKQQQDRGAQVDQISGQVQALNDTVWNAGTKRTDTIAV